MSVLHRESPVVSTVIPRLFIGGEWIDSSDGGGLAVVDPASQLVIAQVASATEADVAAAVAAAQDAFAAWSATSPRHRSEVLRRAFDLMTDRAEVLAHLIVLENGKALADARAEVSYAAEFFRWFSEEAVRLDGSLHTSPTGGNAFFVAHCPVGVCLLVTPWNFPAAMATRKIAPALAAGCAVVLKPADDTPLTALAIAKILADAGVPGGVVNVVPTADSPGVVRAALRNPKVRKLSFTGSTAVGRELLAQAASSVVSCSMELGGNAPFLVLADADVEHAVRGALVAKMRNGGQACTAANRFYVDARVADQFTERLALMMDALQVGPGLEPGTDVGALVSQRALDKVSRLVAGAVAAGATRATRERELPPVGYFAAPTVLVDVPRDAAILREEIFGPVAPIVVFDDVDDAVRQANDTEYGLVSYVFTSDLQTGLSVADALETGMVGLNRGLISDPAAPFGGVKQSGLGREGGHHGLLAFTEPKYVALDWTAT